MRERCLNSLPDVRIWIRSELQKILLEFVVSEVSDRIRGTLTHDVVGILQAAGEQGLARSRASLPTKSNTAPRTKPDGCPARSSTRSVTFVMSWLESERIAYATTRGRSSAKYDAIRSPISVSITDGIVRPARISLSGSRPRVPTHR